jgi:hypothetical protein
VSLRGGKGVSAPLPTGGHAEAKVTYWVTLD